MKPKSRTGTSSSLDRFGTSPARVAWAAGVLLAASFSSGWASSHVTRIDCGRDACTELVIEGDPVATIKGKEAPFRGYADPSLEFDESTGALWMSYSWLKVAGTRGLFGVAIDFVITTHLARSDDRGATFKFEKALNENTKQAEANSKKKGWMSHEVSTLLRRADGQWETIWISYHDPFGRKPHGLPYLERSLASSPRGLGDSVVPWVRGAGKPPVRNVRHDLSKIAALEDCVGFTEPALFAHKGANYLAANCMVWKRGRRRTDLEKLVVLREDGDGYRYLGTLLNATDAAAFGGERIEQGELALSRSGEILLIATPMRKNAYHLGCHVFVVKSLDPPEIERKASGEPVLRAVVTDSVSRERGPGACSYDPQSSTGVLIVRRDFDTKRKPIKMRFAIMATGLHP